MLTLFFALVAVLDHCADRPYVKAASSDHMTDAELGVQVVQRCLSHGYSLDQVDIPRLVRRERALINRQRRAASLSW
jgi:hypothetical protein